MPSSNDVEDGIQQFPRVDGAGTVSWNGTILDYPPAFLAGAGWVALDAFALTFLPAIL